MRKIALSLSILVALALVLAGCTEKTSPPDKVVQNFLDSVKEYNPDKAAQFIYEEGTGSFVNDLSGEGEDSGTVPDAIKVAFSRLSYEIGETTISEDSATVPTTVTAVNMTKIFGEAFTKTLGAILEHLFDENYTQEESNRLMEETLIEGFKDPTAEMNTKNLTIHLKKIEGNWRIVYDDEYGPDIINAITGGLAGVIMEMAEAFEGFE